MDSPAILKVALLGLLACDGFSQTAPPDDPLASRALKISGMPVVEPPAREYQKFFEDVQGMRTSPLSKEARTALDLTDEEIRALADITSDLVAESRRIQNDVKPQVFESRMEVAESGLTSASTDEKLRELQNRWAKTILEHAQRLKASFGQEHFQRLDEFIHSGKPMFGSLMIAGVPVVEPPARDYQKFFDEVKNLGRLPVSEEARKTLHLTDQELRSLIAVTTDLAAESKAMSESSSSTPSQQELQDRKNQWTQTIFDYAERLRDAFGAERFGRVDEFIRSGKSMFEKPASASPETASVPNSN